MNKPSPAMGKIPFLSSRMHNLQEGFVHPPFDYESELLEAIRLGYEGKAIDTIRRINEREGATLSPYPLRSKKNALIASCTLFTRAIIKGGVDPETAFQLSDAMIWEIEKFEDINRLIQFEYEMLLQFMAVLKREKESLTYSPVVNLSIYYIREHIFQELTLKDIASHVRVHSSYLSDKFNRETGMSLTSFINKSKIEESKHFLSYTNQSISELAFLFKFCNQSYYTYLFKKFTGKTPRQYRRESSVFNSDEH